MTVVQVSGVADFLALGARWRDLEQRAAGSFFQSWTWVGCLAAERLPTRSWWRQTEDGRTVALALFNRVRRWFGPAVLYLGESGTADLDCPYVEQNGVLTECGREDELTGLCLRAVTASHDLVLSGIGAPVLAATRRVADLVLAGAHAGLAVRRFGRLRRTGADYLAARSANTRQQIRRSARFYDARDQSGSNVPFRCRRQRRC